MSTPEPWMTLIAPPPYIFNEQDAGRIYLTLANELDPESFMLDSLRAYATPRMGSRTSRTASALHTKVKASRQQGGADHEALLCVTEMVDHRRGQCGEPQYFATLCLLEKDGEVKGKGALRKLARGSIRDRRSQVRDCRW